MPPGAGRRAAHEIHAGKEDVDDAGIVAHAVDVAQFAVQREGVATGQFVLPGVLKITAVSVAAKPKRKGINPFTGQETVFAAKPATVKVKVRPMKKLKDAATA